MYRSVCCEVRSKVSCPAVWRRGEAGGTQGLPGACAGPPRHVGRSAQAAGPVLGAAAPQTRGRVGQAGRDQRGGYGALGPQHRLVELAVDHMACGGGRGRGAHWGGEGGGGSGWRLRVATGHKRGERATAGTGKRRPGARICAQPPTALAASGQGRLQVPRAPLGLDRLQLRSPAGLGHRRALQRGMQEMVPVPREAATPGWQMRVPWARSRRRQLRRWPRARG
jgi:hypothetical protein